MFNPTPPLVRPRPQPIFRPPPRIPGHQVTSAAPLSETVAPPGTPIWSGDPAIQTPATAPAAASPTGGLTYNDAIRKLLLKYGWDPDEIDVYIAGLEKQQEAFTAASGYQDRALAAQIQNAKDARAATLEAARISASASMYGTDTQARTAERTLAQQAEQFKATHGLEVAKAYTQYASTPDMMFARNDFMGAMGRVGQALSPAPMATRGAPRAKTWQDFAALSGYGGNPAVAAGASGGQMAQAGGAGGAGGSGSQADARLKAMRAVGEALPPSDDPGHDDQDWAAINAITSLYFGGNPQGVQRLGAPRRKIAQAGLARAGYDPAAVEHEYQRSLPRQGAARSA